jgi:hypothetical protein
MPSMKSPVGSKISMWQFRLADAFFADFGRCPAAQNCGIPTTGLTNLRAVGRKSEQMLILKIWKGLISSIDLCFDLDRKLSRWGWSEFLSRESAMMGLGLQHDQIGVDWFGTGGAERTYGRRIGERR